MAWTSITSWLFSFFLLYPLSIHSKPRTLIIIPEYFLSATCLLRILNDSQLPLTILSALHILVI